MTFTKRQSIAFSFLLSTLVFGCTKDPLDPTGGGGGNSGSVASFNTIPIPTVNIANQVIPNLSQFYVTNDGPYVQVQNTAALLWSVYKYQGGSGASAWTSFTPTFQASYYRPTSMFYETDNVFGIYWCQDDKYGSYNINTGTPYFTYNVPTGSNGPGGVSELVMPTKAQNTGKIWFMLGNQIWRESAVVSPLKFDKIVDLPASVMRIRTDAAMADPDVETDIWIAAEGRLYQVSSVGNPTPPYGRIVNSWNFNSINPSGRIYTILKVNGNIVIQLDDEVYRQNGTSFNKIGTLNTSVVSNICTNGSTIFSSDGTYYDSNSNSWKSFIGTGTNLSSADQAKYAELQGYCSMGAPIGCAGSGPIYLLALDRLVQITPTY